MHKEGVFTPFRFKTVQQLAAEATPVANRAIQSLPPKSRLGSIKSGPVRVEQPAGLGADGKAPKVVAVVAKASTASATANYKPKSEVRTVPKTEPKPARRASPDGTNRAAAEIAGVRVGTGAQAGKKPMQQNLKIFMDRKGTSSTQNRNEVQNIDSDGDEGEDLIATYNSDSGRAEPPPSKRLKTVKTLDGQAKEYRQKDYPPKKTIMDDSP